MQRIAAIEEIRSPLATAGALIDEPQTIASYHLACLGRGCEDHDDELPY